MVPVRGLTRSFPFRPTRMTLAMITNFSILMTIGPVVAHLGHRFLTLRCLSINSSQEERGDPPHHGHCTFIVELLGRNTQNPEKLCSSYPLVNGLEAGDTAELVTKLIRNGHYRLSDSLILCHHLGVQQFNSILPLDYPELASDPVGVRAQAPNTALPSNASLRWNTQAARASLQLGHSGGR